MATLTMESTKPAQAALTAVLHALAPMYARPARGQGLFLVRLVHAMPIILMRGWPPARVATTHA